MKNEIDFALSQEQETDQLELVGTVLWNKANKIGSFKKLSLPERQFVYIDIFESELNNGGLFSFFFNTSGEFSHDVLEAFYAVNAKESAQIFNEAIRLFPELPVPKDIFLRRQIISSLNNEILQKWQLLEQELISVEENLITLLLYFIKTHKTNFQY